MPPALKDFLDQCKARFVPLEEVLTALQNGGWHEEDQKLARQYYTSLHGPPPQPKVNLHRQISLPLFLGIFFFLVILLSGGSTAAYLVATDIIPLSNLTVKTVISDAVFSIPYLPKSPRYLLTKSTLAHRKLSKNSFDLSLATTSNDFQSLLGMDKFDLRFRGYTDFSQTENPKLSLSVEWGKDFSARILKPDRLIYFKVDTVPWLVTNYMGMSSDQLAPVLANWVVFDPSTLETEARKSIVSGSQADSPVNQTVSKLITRLLDEEILPQLKSTNDSVDGYPCSKLVYQPTGLQLDRLYTKFTEGLNNSSLKTSRQRPSEYLKNLVVSVWIDQEKYYIRKSVITFNLQAPETLPSTMSFSGASVALALKLADFGQPQALTPPATALKPDEFMALIKNTSPKLLQDEQAALNSKFQSDLYTLAAAVTMYHVDHNGSFPSNLSLLVPSYLSKLPDSVAQQNITLKVNRAKTEFLLYAKVPDPSTPDQPFRGWDSIGRKYTHYSQKDINSF